MRDTDDFEQFYRDNIDAVYGYAAARVGPTAAGDVVAEVFTSATRTFACGRGGTLSRAWLITCARARIIDSWQRGGAATTAVSTHQVATSDPSSAVIQLDPTRTAISVGELLDHLHPAERAVLALRHLEGRPVAEVAHLLDRSVESTELLLDRAEVSLQRLTDAYAVDSAEAVA